MTFPNLTFSQKLGLEKSFDEMTNINGTGKLKTNAYHYIEDNKNHRAYLLMVMFHS